MHAEDFDINIEDMSKIEGHASLELKVRKGEVQDVKLKVFENRRFFEFAVRGKNYAAVPQLVSRICGTCSAAHLMCSIKCIEHAFGFQPTEQTKLLRDLTLYGVNIRDHAMHLFHIAFRTDLLAHRDRRGGGIEVAHLLADKLRPELFMHLVGKQFAARPRETVPLFLG